MRNAVAQYSTQHSRICVYLQILIHKLQYFRWWHKRKIVRKHSQKKAMTKNVLLFSKTSASVVERRDIVLVVHAEYFELARPPNTRSESAEVMHNAYEGRHFVAVFNFDLDVDIRNES